MAASRLTDSRTRTAVTEVSYRAGIDDIDIRDFVEVTLFKARGAHLFTNGFAIGLVDFAA
jgi:hypothetical protein